jgi:hypothetical protein
MLTYQLQERHLVSPEGMERTYPNDAEIRMQFGPPEPFGTGRGLSRMGIIGGGISAYFDANSGRVLVGSELALEPIEVVTQFPDMGMTTMFQGDLFFVHIKCESEDRLNAILQTFYFHLPMLLNAELYDAPIVKTVEGRVGVTPFRWEFSEGSLNYQETTLELQQHHVARSIQRLTYAHKPAYTRLFAGLNYFHVACRLASAGNTAHEFLAETILNLTKVLEILFGHDIRENLRALGYSEAAIDGDFFPLITLRNEIDVAHVLLGQLDRQHLLVLYGYIDRAEGILRELFGRIFAGIEAGTFALDARALGAPNERQQRSLNRIVHAIEARNQEIAAAGGNND